MSKKQKKSPKKTNKVGRPTKYRANLVNELDAFTKGANIPYLEEFASEIGVDEDTITNWGKEHRKFFGAIKRLKTKQKAMLQKLGLHNKVNSSMAIFQLKANHGLMETEKRQIEYPSGISISVGGDPNPEYLTTRDNE